MLILVIELEVVKVLLLSVMVKELEMKMFMLSVMVKKPEMKMVGQFTTIAGRQHKPESLLPLD